MDDIDFAALIGRVRQGEQEAMTLLVSRYGGEVRMMVRRRLPVRLRSQFDSMDFTQAVWSSVLVDCRERPEPFTDPKHLLGFLSGVVQNKVTEQFRRLTKTRKYDISREESLYVRRGDRDLPRDVASADATPSEKIQAEDRMDQLTAGRSPLEVEIINLRQQDLTFAEIGKRLGIHEKSVRRVIDALRTRQEERRWA